MFGFVGANLAERVRILFMRAVLYMEVAWFDRDANTSGNLTSRLAKDAPTVRGAVGDTLGVIVQNAVTLTMGFIIAFVNGWKMTLVVLAVLPLLGFATYVQTAVMTGAAGRCGRGHVPLEPLSAPALVSGRADRGDCKTHLFPDMH